MNNNYYWSLIAASKKKLPPIWVEYIVARAGDFSLPAYDTIQENIVTDTDHLASVQLYDSDNELTANLRPCLSTEKGHYLEGCLYDVVKKKFYYSQNAGVKHGDIMREVEYIEGTGTQYIDTQITPTINTKAQVKFAITESNSIGFWGARKDLYRFCSTTFTSATRFGIGMTDNTWPNNRVTIVLNYIYDCIVANGYASINGTEYTETKLQSFGNAGNFTLSRISNSITKTKIYLCKLWDNNVLIFDAIPVRDKYGVICMYDFVSGRFFTNLGTGVFIAGKDVNDLFNVVEKEGVFLNRTTGDGLNVKDKSLAHITSLKGNTLIFNQLLKDGKVVDMGLPSGTLWATCDIDVTKPDGFANTPFTYEKSFFSWGNVDGHNPSSTSAFSYNWGGVNAAVPWYEGQPYGNTKGNTLTGDIPVGEEFDAARANLGSSWRMPTKAEFTELFAGSIYIDADGNEVDTSKANKLATVNGIVGLYLQSKTNGNRLFFACSGYGDGSSWSRRGAYGYYWSPSFGSSRLARGLHFSSGGVLPQYNGNRYYGFAVRAVLKPSNIITTGSNNHKYYMKNNKNIFDLTKMFGAGKEPATAEEFEAMFPAYYYDYDAGSLLNVDAGGIKSFDVGKTKWDNLYFIDDTHTLSSLTGKAEGSSVSEVIFPDGMKRVNNAYDELTDVKDGCFTKAIKRIGGIYLGNAQLSVGIRNHTFVVTEPTKHGTNLIINKDYTNIPGGVEGIVAFVDYCENNSITYGISTNNVLDNRMYIYNGNKTTLPTSQDNWLSGITAYYELATPITYTLDTPVPCNYKVWKGGTEIVVPENTEALTAPVDMSVKYIVEENE